ncbi:Hpt domain-containing protein [Isoptericola sp. NPDC057653]|uniref:Hpt domain-containing protein n=1 Tax=Isoptericola sp. NPDC057653 TaxID=3346195 RepID=UPI0036A23D01
MTSADPEGGLSDAVVVLARRARARNVGRARRILELLDAPGAPLDRAAREEAEHLCHTVTGSASTFGDLELAGATQRLEAALHDGRAQDAAAALDAVRTAIAPADEAPGSPDTAGA